MPAEEDVAAARTNTAIDPFASDLFAVTPRNGCLQSGDTAGSNQRPALVPFRDRLKRITASDARASLAMASLPEGISAGVVTRVLALVTQLHEREIQICLTSLKECEPTGVDLFATGDPKVFAVLTVQPDAFPLVVELDAGFASMIVDRTLGGDGKYPDCLRALSPIETAVV